MIRVTLHLLVIIVLSALTQIGGLVWAVALISRRKLLAFGLLYPTLTVLTIWLAPVFGRIALSCLDDGPLQMHSWIYCATNRNYVVPELANVLEETAQQIDRRFPGTQTLVLDAGFPFIDGFPLLPHLSHDDGEKADLAFYYRDETGYLPGATRSPIGYFAFEQGTTHCRQEWPTLRWDLSALQPFWRSYELDYPRNRALLALLTDDDRVGRVFVEPHLVGTLGAAHPKIGFQGCRAARHDDHIHLQLK